jgi:hypothetical protein
MADAQATGQLQVFSALERNDEGDNLDWYQHTDYSIYNMHGKRVMHVGNTVGHYEGAPRVVSLPPGRYIVAAEAKDALRVRVPVEIKRGRLSRIHLDDRWNLPPDTPTGRWVSMPSGAPVGWRADIGNEVGFR